MSRNAPQAPAPLLAGVCSAVSTRLHVDVAVVRLAFLLFALAWGLGVAAYGLGWFVLAGRNWQSLRADAHARLSGIRSHAEDVGQRVRAAKIRVDAPRLLGSWGAIALGLLVTGCLTLMGSFGMFAWITPLRAFGLGALTLGGAATFALIGADR